MLQLRKSPYFRNLKNISAAQICLYYLHTKSPCFCNNLATLGAVWQTIRYASLLVVWPVASSRSEDLCRLIRPSPGLTKAALPSDRTRPGRTVPEHASHANIATLSFNSQPCLQSPKYGDCSHYNRPQCGTKNTTALQALTLGGENNDYSGPNSLTSLDCAGSSADPFAFCCSGWIHSVSAEHRANHHSCQPHRGNQ